jgi:hypothetical protein
MCDYSLANIKSRKAAKGDKLIVHGFPAGTRGFTVDPYEAGGATATCVLPTTTIAFDRPIEKRGPYDNEILGWKYETLEFTVGMFVQINKDQHFAHHDAIEFRKEPEPGQPEPAPVVVVLNDLKEGQTATVVGIPTPATTEEEAKAQERLPMAESTIVHNGGLVDA